MQSELLNMLQPWAINMSQPLLAPEKRQDNIFSEKAQCSIPLKDPKVWDSSAKDSQGCYFHQ